MLVLADSVGGEVVGPGGPGPRWHWPPVRGRRGGVGARSVTTTPDDGGAPEFQAEHYYFVLAIEPGPGL